MISVMVVEDSRTERSHLARIFREAGDFRVVAQAADGDEAIKLIETAQPQLVSLDVFLPGRSAVEVVRALMARAKVPIVLVSDAPKGATEVFEALAAGALDLVKKPRARAETATFLRLMRTLGRPEARQAGPAAASLHKVVALASSTGGTGPLREVLAGLPSTFPAGVVVAQHIAEGFGGALMDWLGEATSLPVRAARSGELVTPGQVFLAPPDHDVEVGPRGRLSVRRAPPRGYHPSASLLFSSLAPWGPNALAVVLSGVGSDGLEGGVELVAAGGQVMAQDQRTSAVYGMPAAVTRAGLVSFSGSPAQLTQAIIAWAARQASSKTR